MGKKLGPLGWGSVGTSGLLGAVVWGKVGIERSAGVLAVRRASGLGGSGACGNSKGSQGSSPASFCPRCFFPSPARRKPDIPVPYLYFDLGAAVLCASFMSFGVKRRWFALGAALQLAISTYAAYIGGYVHYGDWLKVSTSAQDGTSLGGWGARGQYPVPRGI